MLVGNLLAVGPLEVAKVAGLYALVGVLHWLCRRPFFLISTDPRRGLRAGVAGTAVGLRVLRLVRRGGGQLRPRRRRVAGVLLPDRAGAGRRHAGRIGARASADRLGLRHPGQRPRHGRLRRARPAHRCHHRLRVRGDLAGLRPRVSLRPDRAAGSAPVERDAVAPVVLLVLLLVGCATTRPIHDAAELSGEWKGRVTSPQGHAPATLSIAASGAFKGTMYLDAGDRVRFTAACSSCGPGRCATRARMATASCACSDDHGRTVLRFLRDDGGVDATFRRF